MGLGDTWLAGTASSIDEAHVEQFKDEVIHLAQQGGSRLRDKVRVDTVKGNTHNFERLGSSAAVQKTTRHTLTPIVDVPHSRRKVDLDDYLWGDLIDKEDLIRMLIEPKSAYAQNAAMAMGRKWDDLIIAGAIGAATDGAGGSVAFDTTNQLVAHGGVGMTLTKLLQTKEIMDGNEVPEEGRVIVISSEELRALLGTTEITSSDYNTVKALVRGEINEYLGFQFVRTELLTDDATNRHCIAFQRDCVGLAVGSDIMVRTDERPDVSYAWQVFASFSCNATRIDDAGVVRIDCLMA